MSGTSRTRVESEDSDRLEERVARVRQQPAEFGEAGGRVALGADAQPLRGRAHADEQPTDLLAVDVYGLAGLQLDTTRPLYGANAPEPMGSKGAQIAAARYLNSRAWTIFGGTNEVQSTIIAKSVLGL